MWKKLHLRYWIAFGFLALLLMSFIVWNINSGSIEISVREIMEILFLGKGVRKSELPFPFFSPRFRVCWILRPMFCGFCLNLTAIFCWNR